MKANLCQKILGALKFNYLKEDDSELGKVDFGVFTVAMMVAALGGVIRPDEFKAFSRLAEECRVSRGEKAARYNSALHSAGYVLLLARSGMSKRAAVESFCARVADIMKKRRDCRKDRLWFGLRPVVAGARKAKTPAEDSSGLLAAAEKAVRSGSLAEIRNFIIKG